ncbi:hypothetical protein [Aquisalibacillus elongatus]|uniref:DUF3566 domain-containing protein n=1 Tax=Aquisalibacillus elongatus TaxID=485577 RepID=A0A3N5BFU1_9BACI|nr:hypothetical protein [Aquisalibacillus elongatus]RPF54160.1 hypothetical protein EDC24_1352 [Aquisalibacillus elongatus]
MNQVEVKRVGVKSVFKVLVYLLSLPLSIFFVVGIVASVIGMSTSQLDWVATFGPFIIMPFFFIAFYGLLSMLIAAVYNFLAKRFGGLKLQVQGLEEKAE